jgi:DNA-binding PadR family transcriptional regulator
MRPHFENGRHGHHRHCGGRDGAGRHGGGHERDGGPFGRGGRGGGGRQRVFDHGALRLVVLALIAEAPRHGYELIKAIEERLAGSYSPSPGVIYPTLTLLQELGHATVEEGEGKKRYSITDEGRSYLAANQPAVDAAMARMQAVNARHGGGPAPQIIRAMENLKLALRLRMNRGPLSEDELAQVAAALDAAAVTIERS